MKRILHIAPVAFVFGLLSAYGGIQIFDNIHVDSEKPNNRWYDSVIFTLSSAAVIHKEAYSPADIFSESKDRFRNQEIIPVMLLNGLSWMVIAVIFSLPIMGMGAWWRESSRS